MGCCFYSYNRSKKCQIICFNDNFVGNRSFNNCAAEQILTNSLKVEKITKQSSKILIDILYIPFLDI